MKKTAITLAALTFGIGTVLAGPAPVVSTGKSTPPPPLMDPCAGPISYSNIELLYVNTDFDGYGGDLDGGSLRFEYAVASNFYIAAGGNYSSGGDTDVWSLSLGVGGSIPLTENIHLVGEVGGAYVEAESERYVTVTEGQGFYDSYNEDEWGWYVRPHLRAKFGCFEIHAGAEYQDIFEEEWAFYAKVYYQVAPGWDLTAGAREGEDSTQWSAGVRYRY